MDKSEDEMEEDETEWKSSFVDSVPLSPAAAASGKIRRLGKCLKPVCFGFHLRF